MKSEPIELGSPWYQNFWPWFIVVLLGASVVGSLVSVAIAYHHKDIDIRASAPTGTSHAPDRESRNLGR
jgi:hypothetical protein